MAYAEKKMKTLGSSMITTALSGLLILVPLAILFLAVMQIWELLEDMAALAALDLPFPAVVNALIYLGLILAAIFILCRLVGLLLRSDVMRRYRQEMLSGHERAQSSPNASA